MVIAFVLAFALLFGTQAAADCRCLENGGQSGPPACPCDVEQCYAACVRFRCPDTPDCTLECSRRCACNDATECPTHVDPGPTPMPGPCFGDRDGDRAVTVDELVGAVAHALDGCP
ncbi:MAG TPA: hypothetical protein VL049_13130 [Candidatus Dormibacteraeota bacterium]|nr:hypothetical protein [Candidatus Dormibacteraeota bacterium]